ncbi:MAG: alpha/beta fold hydrolase [Deltaproteobacteria bacterium]|nr:alpha/beta fold hydrolase [Deltaproteobacteria bacterium]
MKFKHNIDTEPFKHLYPFASNYMEVNGFQYHYVDEGSGDPVVMLHGNPTWSFYYRELIKAFSEDHRMIAPDHIGCGLSEKPAPDRYGYTLSNRVADLKTFIDKLQLRRKITLVLHDWGGMIGCAWALEHLDNVEKLVVLNTAAFLPPGTKKIPLRLWILRHLTFLATPAVLGFNLFSRAAVYMAASKSLAQDVNKGLTAPYNSWKNRIATLKFVQDIPVFPNDESYAMVKNSDRHLDRLKKIPMLILWGEKDFVFDMDYLAEWRRRFPEAQTHTFAQAGHYVLEDAPGDVIAKIKTFLDVEMGDVKC